jgi:hypothetical protein
VKARRHQVLDKMHIRSLAELISIAEWLGLLETKSNTRI